MEKTKYVPVFLDRAGRDEQNFVFAAVNGKAWQIPRGTAVMVPWFVAEELRRAKAAERRRDEYVRRCGT